MSTYETFVAPCPHCGKETGTQSKLGQCAMKTCRLDDEVSGFGYYHSFNAKEPCVECDQPLAVKIVTEEEGGTVKAWFRGLVKPDPNWETEGYFGALYAPGETSTDFWEEAEREPPDKERSG